MITVSDSFKTELENGNRNYLVKVDITLADSTVLPTITKDNLIDLSIEDAVSQDTKFTALGGAVINKAVINIDNSDENYSNYNFNNATATIQIGLQVNGTPEYVDRGVYIVDSVSPKGVGLELSCLDYMSKFDKSYTNSEIVYPATIQEVIEDACTICGVAFTGTYPDSDYVLTITPPVATFREVLSAIGQITGTFAHVDRQGQLYFSWFNTTLLNQAIDSNTKIDGVHYIENVIDNTYEKDNITIDGVRAYIINEESNEKFEYHYPSALADDSFCLNITGNPLIHGGNITEIINRVGPRIVGLTIRQTNCKHVNNPLIEAGDIAMVLYSVKNNTNAYYPIVITRTTFAINQAQETVCGVETLSENLDGRYSDTQLLREQTKKDTNDARKVATNYLSADTTGIMIADLATLPMSEPGIPITNGIIPILGLLVMHLVISLLNLKSLKLREIICGKPSILISHGIINEKNMKKERFTINELEERLRGNNVFNISDVEYAILETSGQITVIQKPNKRNAIPEDFNINPEYEGIAYDLVVDGKVMRQNLDKINREYSWLVDMLRENNMTPQETLLATIDGKGNFFCQKKEGKGKNV